MKKEKKKKANQQRKGLMILSQQHMCTKTTYKIKERKFIYFGQLLVENKTENNTRRRERCLESSSQNLQSRQQQKTSRHKEKSQLIKHKSPNLCRLLLHKMVMIDHIINSSIMFPLNKKKSTMFFSIIIK